MASPCSLNSGARFGGAGTPAHFQLAFEEAHVDAALAASVFHSGTIEIGDLKRALRRRGLRPHRRIGLPVILPALGMPDDAMASTLDSGYLSRDPNPARKAAYIQRTMAKARLWANR